MLVAVVGDVHGRFFRVEEWVDALEQARGERVSSVLCVGDVETFSTPDDHRRKATKRSMPAEFSAYATGEREMARPFYFVGGNNESFEELDVMPDGGTLAPKVHYLGRAGSRVIDGLRVGFLSGIYAPTRYMRPRVPASNAETNKQAGYFRKDDVDAACAVEGADLLLMHEWPRGIAGTESAVAVVGARGIRRAHWPQVGNPYAALLVTRLRPTWVLCGHIHVPHAATLYWDNGATTRVACLDQATRSDGGLLWMNIEGTTVKEVGWGTTGEVAWREGELWDEKQSASRIRIAGRGEY